MVVVNTTDRAELSVWVVDLLAQMFELNKAKLRRQSNLYADLDIGSIDASTWRRN